MADSSPTSQASGIVNFATGVLDPTDATAITVTLGFTARHVRVWNEDLVEHWEKFEGMSATQSIKTAAVATTPASSQTTLDTGSAIVINTDGTITISATAAGTGDRVMWAAWG